MKRIYNFSAGPSMLPLPVLEKAREEMLAYGTTGQSVMEMSHRSPAFEPIIAKTQALLRQVMSIPDNYKVLFLQGGATNQFSAIPLNLLPVGGTADYILSGMFSGKAFEEGRRFGDVRCVATSKATGFTTVPRVSKGDFNPNASYVHICYNNTIFGTRFDYTPDTGDIPLVADMSSYILSEPFDVSKYGVIYAGAQKNMAPAGLTVVIVREDLLGRARADIPVMLDWKIAAENDSMYNTPPTFPIYMLGLVCEWILGLGGLGAMEKINRDKAALLYDFIDSTDYYISPVAREFRSQMNVTFTIGDETLEKKFAKEAEAAGFANIKGHRAVGGMRASIYNAMPTEGVAALVEFMRAFEKANPKK